MSWEIIACNFSCSVLVSFIIQVMQTWKMNWAVLCLILCTIRIYATFELFPLGMFENIHQWSYVYHKLCFWKNTNFVFNLFNSTEIFIFIIFSHSVALLVKWLVRFFYIIEFIGIKLYLVAVGWIMALITLLPLCGFTCYVLLAGHSPISWNPADPPAYEKQ